MQSEYKRGWHDGFFAAEEKSSAMFIGTVFIGMWAFAIGLLIGVLL